MAIVDSLARILGTTEDELLDSLASETEPREISGSKQTQSQELVELAFAQGIELFHTPDQVAYASIPADGHIETWPLKKLRPWLSRLFYGKNKKPPGGQALQDALNVLEAQALFEGPSCYPVNTRVAQQDGKIYIDLANDSWQVVEVSPSGWRVLDTSLVKFRRTKGMLSLPVPQRGGTLDLLREFVNAADDSQWVLLVSWLLFCFSSGPYPVLLLQGEQGCAKSTTARVLKSLVDPNISHLRTSPRDERDLFVAATNSWVLAFDNLSGISDWLSDAFCRLSTGGGLVTRQLYSDNEETIFEAKRPLVLNGIDDLAWRHDLLDRAIVLNLPVIPESERKPEKEFLEEFEEARPYIFGALLDVLATGLRNLPSTKLDRLPRMADFAVWVSACEEALPWPAGSFMAAYTGNRQEQIDSALESDPLAQAVKRLLDEHGGTWEGTASELLEALEEYVDERGQRSKSWPESPKSLGRKLKRSAAFLRQAGVEVDFVRSGKKGTRSICVYYRADISHYKMSANEASKIGHSDITDVSDINFSLESKNQKKETPLDRVGNLTSEMSALSEVRIDAGSKADISESKMSAIPVKCQPDLSALWDTLLSAVASEELRGLLEFARTCGAEIAWEDRRFRYCIKAREALGDDYPAWKKAMLPHTEELRTALVKLPPPKEKLHLSDVPKEASKQGGDNLSCQPGFTFSQEELWTRFLAALESEEAKVLFELARKRGARIVWDDREKKYQVQEDDVLNREYIAWYGQALRYIGEVNRSLDSLVVWEEEVL